MLGAHCIRAYSVTQKCVTLSSAEAELMALVKAASEAIGLCQLAASWGLPMTAILLTDSSAALAVTQRRGCGKLRHVRIGHLWVQEANAAGTIEFGKVAGAENPADLLTKHLAAPKATPLFHSLGQNAEAGEAGKRLHLRALRSARGLRLPTKEQRAILYSPGGACEQHAPPEEGCLGNAR